MSKLSVKKVVMLHSSISLSQILNLASFYNLKKGLKVPDLIELVKLRLLEAFDNGETMPDCIHTYISYTQIQNRAVATITFVYIKPS